MRRRRLVAGINRPVARVHERVAQAFHFRDQRVDLILLPDHDGVQLIDGIGRVSCLTFENLKALLDIFREIVIRHSSLNLSGEA
jgi:hypothetical protein